jgi:hypothetical protein
VLQLKSPFHRTAELLVHVPYLGGIAMHLLVTLCDSVLFGHASPEAVRSGAAVPTLAPKHCYETKFKCVIF